MTRQGFKTEPLNELTCLYTRVVLAQVAIGALLAIGAVVASGAVVGTDDHCKYMQIR